MRRHLTFLAVILLVDLLCLYQILLDLGSLVLIRIPSAFGKYLDSIVDRRVMAGCHHQTIR